jgi:hypothetical protein
MFNVIWSVLGMSFSYFDTFLKVKLTIKKE